MTIPSGINRIVLIALTTAASALAQFGPPPQSGASSQAVQLPLSGRTSPTSPVSAAQTPLPGVTTSVNTVTTSVQVQGIYSGSTPGTKPLREPGKLTFEEAVQRGIEFNLGPTNNANALAQATGQTRIARSALLPKLSANLREVVQQTNLAAMGVRIPFAPSIVGPFNYFDARATVTQNLLDFTALNNYRATKASARAAELFLEDARDLVVLAVGGVYLQAVAAAARIRSAEAQFVSAQALLQQSQQQREAGVLSLLDLNRVQIDLQTSQQRLATLRNDFAKQKITLARLVGLPTSAEFELSADVQFTPPPDTSIDAATKSALGTRADLKAAESQVQAAERALAAARAERLPSLSVSADYGLIGINPAQSHGTFSVAGNLRIPLWQGGRVSGDIQVATAALAQRRSEVADLRERIESEIRTAFLDLEAAASQVQLAQDSQRITDENLKLIRERQEVGIATNVEVLQGQTSRAAADLDYITSLFAHNVAKLNLARALGGAQKTYTQFVSIR